MWSFDFSSAPSAYVWGSRKHPKAIYGIISPPLSPTEKSAQETLLVVIFMKIRKVNARGGAFRLFSTLLPKDIGGGVQDDLVW